MREFRILPHDAKAKGILDREFLWCGLQLLLDEEEELARLCPSCRLKAEEHRCTACGILQDAVSTGVNENFDLNLFYQRGRGEVGC